MRTNPDKVVFMGSSNTGADMEAVFKDMDEAFSLLNALQQPGRPANEEEARQDREGRAELERQLRALVDSVAHAFGYELKEEGSE
jgi:hypothetical protein